MSQRSPYTIVDSTGDHVFRKRAVEEVTRCFDFGPRLLSGVVIVTVDAVNITSEAEQAPTLTAADTEPNGTQWVDEADASVTIVANEGAKVTFSGGTAGVGYDVEIVVTCSDGQVKAGLLRMEVDAATGEGE